jgi:DNA-binding CsgD family transcriptional regulator
MREKMKKPNSDVQKGKKNTSKFKIEERRRKVAELLAQSYTETEIANELGVSVATISRDVTVLKEKSQQFVYDLARSDLAFYYQRCIDGVNAVKREAWQLLRSNNSLKPGERLSILKLIKDCEEAGFSMLHSGPSAMALKAMQEEFEHFKEDAEKQTKNRGSEMAGAAAQA